MANSRHFSKSSFLDCPDFAASLSISLSMSFGILTDTTAVSPLYRLIGIWSFGSSIPPSPPPEYLLYHALYYNCIHLSTHISHCTKHIRNNNQNKYEIDKAKVIRPWLYLYSNCKYVLIIYKVRICAFWYARQDSNLRPCESESHALSSCATGTYLIFSTIVVK